MKRICCLIVCLAVTVSNIIFVYAQNDAPQYIDIGNTESEQDCIEYTAASEPQTNTVDGAEHTFRTLNPNGSMTFTMECAPDKTNYLTVKLWGSDTGDGMLWLTDTDGNMNVGGDKPPERNSGVVDRRDWVELNFSGSSPQYEGGFIYSTYIIPKVYTEGKTEVTLKIYSTGGSADYAEDKVKEQTEPSRGIYALYMTQDPYFEPSEYGAVSGQLAPAAQSEMKSYDEYKAQLLQYAKDAVDTFKSWQIYGADNYPSYMEGMITRTTGWKNKDKTDENWKSAYYNSNGMLKQNMTPLNGYEVFALAYKNADTLGYGAEEKEELLDRIVKGMDFLCRAQGENGGFFSSDGWIGGPDRKNASGSNLTGFGLRSAAYALDAVYDDVKAGGDDLDKYIDMDADGYIDTSVRRKGAWETMAAAARDYLTSLDGAGHAPNQDMADIIAALRFNNVLKRMGSSKAWDETEITHELDMAFGLEPNICCSSYWVSPKGLILENFGSIQGGYSGDYGIMALEEMSQLAELAGQYLTADKAAKYADIVKKAYEASDNFMFTANASIGGNPTLYSEGITSNRNAYYPGTERYVLDGYAALTLGDDTALKAFYNFLAHDKMTAEHTSYEPSNAHYEDNALSLIRLYLGFDDITDAFEGRSIADYDYIMEDDAVDEYAWADEMGRNVVIKNGDDKIYLALNWRNPLRSVDYYNTERVKDNQQGLMNNLARVHHKTDKYDSYGYAELTTVGWNVKTAAGANYQKFVNHYAEAFMYMNYGGYAVIMNSNNLMGRENNVSYPVPYEELGLNGVYKDLISGKSYYFGEAADGAEDGTAAQVAPASTMVLYRTAPRGEATVTDVAFENGVITVTATTDEGTAAPVTVYAAAYKGSVLADVRKYSGTINGEEQLNFKYEKPSGADKVRIYVWDDNMKPLYKSEDR